LFLAALIQPVPVEHAPRRIQVAQACLGALGIWLIAAIAGRAAGPRAAVTAAAIAAVFPPLIWMPSYVLSETLYSVVALAVALVLITVLCVAPWTIRNHRVYGRWIAVASEGGVTFWTGNHALARGDGDLASNVDLKRAELAFRATHPGLTPEQLEPLYYRD